ncbi:MAG: hypothetical protein M0R74_02175 [Dehalococcoidia bacterium]|nr:hypothetical protein [Dehalococcoidia bacterium]
MLRAETHDAMLSFRKFSSRRRVERLIRDGVGLREASWPLAEEAAAPVRQVLTEDIVAWVREAMGEMRRPNGIDQVALALACRDGAGRVQLSNAFGVVRPKAFYEEDGVARVAAFLEDVEAVPATKRHEIVGALLSLGDIAYELGA